MAAISYADGADLVPAPVASEIIKQVEETSAAMRLFKRVNMSSKTLKTPVQSVLPSAYWVSEGGTKQTTEVNWTSQTITAEELAVIVPVADNLLADSAFDVWAEVQSSLAAAFARKIDLAVLFGTDAPASFADSIVEGAIAASNYVNKGTNDAAAGGVAQDVLDAMALVYADGYRVNGFAAADLFNFSLLSARDANGNPLLGSNASVDTLYGRQVAYVGGSLFGNAPGDTLLIAGDFEKAVIGLRQDISYYLSKDATVGGVSMFETDQTAIRATMRIGFTVFTPVNRSSESSKYPFAVLRNAPSGSSSSASA